MRYEKNVDRSNPGCIVFLVDQSGSMLDSFAGSRKSKCEAVATAINRFLGELITICEKGEDEPRHYFDVGVIGYTSDENGQPRVGSLLNHGALGGRALVSVVELYNNPLDIESRPLEGDSSGSVVNYPIWYRNPPQEMMMGTPMRAGLLCCHTALNDWCSTHSKSFPPLVIHLTDGDSTDGNPEEAANGLKSLYTDDGNLLLFNCHLSDSAEQGVLFPTTESQFSDQFGRLLFRMSSLLPERMLSLASAKNLSAPASSRGMAFNTDSMGMLKLIAVGTVISSAINPLR